MVGLRIRDYLNSKGIRFNFLSNKTGIKYHALASMLKGTRQITCEEYSLICDALEVPFETFLKG